MQYVGQTGRSLKTRFREHFRKMKKSKKFDTFLYRHFKNNGHSPSKIVIQPVEKIIYDPNSSTRFKNIKRHETELKWIKFLQSPFPLGFNDNIYHEGNISKMPDFDVFSVLECKKRKSRSHGKRKNGNIKRKICTEKRLNTSLKDLSLALTNHGRHGLFSFLSSLPISVLRNLELEANKLYDRAKQHSLQDVMFNISLVLISILRSTINDILSKFHSLTKVLSLLIYIVSSRIIQ